MGHFSEIVNRLAHRQQDKNEVKIQEFVPLIMTQSPRDEDEENTPLENNITASADDEYTRNNHITEMRQQILFLKRSMYMSNAFVLSFALIIILLYFTTSTFDGVKMRDKLKTCAHAELDLRDFETCSEICSDHLCCFDDSCADDSTGDQVDCDAGPYFDCEPLNHLLSPARNVELKEVCSEERISSSKENKKECAEKCKISECCWKDALDENCMSDQTQLCAIYLPCAIYYVNQFGMGVGSVGMGIGPVIIEEKAGKTDSP